jgi:hypothetical protein
VKEVVHARLPGLALGEVAPRVYRAARVVLALNVLDDDVLVAQVALDEIVLGVHNAAGAVLAPIVIQHSVLVAQIVIGEIALGVHNAARAVLPETILNESVKLVTKANNIAEARHRAGLQNQVVLELDASQDAQLKCITVGTQLQDLSRPKRYRSNFTRQCCTFYLRNATKKDHQHRTISVKVPLSSSPGSSMGLRKFRAESTYAAVAANISCRLAFVKLAMEILKMTTNTPRMMSLEARFISRTYNRVVGRMSKMIVARLTMTLTKTSHLSLE